MYQTEGASRDMAAMVAPQVGRLAETGDAWQPTYRPVDGDFGLLWAGFVALVQILVGS